MAVFIRLSAISSGKVKNFFFVWRVVTSKLVGIHTEMHSFRFQLQNNHISFCGRAS